MQSADSIRKPFPAIVALSAGIASFLIWLIYFKGRGDGRNGARVSRRHIGPLVPARNIHLRATQHYVQELLVVRLADHKRIRFALLARRELVQLGLDGVH